MKWTTVLFDLDGTLTDPAAGIVNSILHALGRMGIAEPDPSALTAFIGPPLHESFASRYNLSAQEAFRAVDFYREYFAHRGIFENRLYPGIETLMANLARKGVCLVLATSKPTIYAGRILDYFSLSRFFTYVQGSEMDGRRTRKQDVIRAALAGVSGGAGIMVGDRAVDVSGARSNGLAAIAVTWGYARDGELEAASPAHIAPTVAELGALLGVP